MKIELKNVKHAKFASQETECFEATVYIDGVKRGTVSNDGWGGCNAYHPNSLGQELEAYAKTLPKYEYAGHMLSHSADGLIDEAFVEVQVQKEVKKLVTKTVCFFDPDTNEIRGTKQLPADRVQACLDGKVKLPWVKDNWVCLNRLPFNEACDLYRKVVHGVTA